MDSEQLAQLRKLAAIVDRALWAHDEGRSLAVEATRLINAINAVTHVSVPLPDGAVRIFEPAADSDDASRMYVLDVLDFSIMVRLRRDKDGTVTPVVDISEDPGGVLTVHVRGIENTYG